MITYALPGDINYQQSALPRSEDHRSRARPENLRGRHPPLHRLVADSGRNSDPGRLAQRNEGGRRLHDQLRSRSHPSQRGERVRGDAREDARREAFRARAQGRRGLPQDARRGTRWPGTRSRTMAAPRCGCPDCPSACRWSTTARSRFSTIRRSSPSSMPITCTTTRSFAGSGCSTAFGVPDVDLYHAILDVNPVAAPGSGESEYPNDFFPINLTSLFFDNDSEGLDYVRSMLELTLDPPANAGVPQTLPLLVCGSPTYDPQAPGWFRTRYKDQLPKDPWTGSPSVNVLQAGFVKIRPDSKKPTPYMIANHMIAASVMGRWTDAPARRPTSASTKRRISRPRPFSRSAPTRALKGRLSTPRTRERRHVNNGSGPGIRTVRSTLRRRRGR